ncbi:MAG: glycosyltransferase [Planctomycetia bacterium]|nr:glycosyltransferase [Planctomycetia bacterium]
MVSHSVIVWTVLAWTLASIWIAVIFAFVGAWRRRPLLRPHAPGPDSADLPRLSVIVAARDEAGCIETCIRSLFRQDYPDLEVVAVNDRSSDETPAILDRLASDFPGRLRVIHVSELPAGWFGKPHALDRGLQTAAGSAICFTDADCEFLSPLALRTTVNEMHRRDLDFFSIAARYSLTSLRECVAVPCCCESLMSWFRPERVSDPRRPEAFANGAFILVRRGPFERIGGWEAVRSKISEDLELARHAKRLGLKLGLAEGQGFYRTDSYRTVRESWNGWSRIFKGALTPLQLSITLCRSLVLSILPLIAVTWGLCNLLATGDAWLMHGAGPGFLVALSLRCLLDLVVFRLVGAPVAAAILAPLGRIFMLAAVTRALLSHAGLVHTHWRGATFSSGQMVMPQPAKA